MKPKVTAQRKFAQGAHVPHTTPINTSIERKTEAPPSQENVLHCKTSAKSLLDMVSFKNMQICNLQPVVLLKRLGENSSDALCSVKTQQIKKGKLNKLKEKSIVKLSMRLRKRSETQKKIIQLKKRKKYRQIERKNTKTLKRKTDSNMQICNLQPVVLLKRLEENSSDALCSVKTQQIKKGKLKKLKEKSIVKLSMRLRKRSETQKKFIQLKKRKKYRQIERKNTKTLKRKTDSSNLDKFSIDDLPLTYLRKSMLRDQTTKLITAKSVKFAKGALTPSNHESTQEHNFKKSRRGQGMAETNSQATPLEHPEESNTNSDTPGPSYQTAPKDAHMESFANKDMPEPSFLTPPENEEYKPNSEHDEQPYLVYEDDKPNSEHGTQSEEIEKWLIENDTIEISDDEDNKDNIDKSIMLLAARCQNDSRKKLRTNSENSNIMTEAVTNEPIVNRNIPEDSVFNPGNNATANSSSKKTTSDTVQSGGRSRTKKTKNSNPVTTVFPRSLDSARLVEAPVFYPTTEEFTNPIAYYEKIMPIAAKFGICKVVAPPNYKPPCVLNETHRFTVANHYISRLFSRWGTSAREMGAIKAYLSTQGVNFTRAPLVDGLEINLPKMFHIVNRLRGSKAAFDKKKWNRVADELHFHKLINPEKKLDQIYVKYLLPYDSLTPRERAKTILNVDQAWFTKNRRLLERAINPFHRQKRLLGESDSSDDDEPTEDDDLRTALTEAEDCIAQGRAMTLINFRKVAITALKMYVHGNDNITTTAIENLYWKLVLLGTDHVCVNAASLNTAEQGLGFNHNENSPNAKHPWNLKSFSENSSNLLRSLHPFVGITVPTLHFGMIFSTSCWHSDPHGLPWIEYLHEGAEKIWYGIPNAQNKNFRNAVETLCPTAAQNKKVWLPSDITMIPPNLLLEHDVSLSRITQKPGEYIVVFPKAFSSSVCTGFTISESVYFATNSYLNVLQETFQEIRASSEPTTFAIDHLLIAIASDQRAPLSVLHQVHSALAPIITDELSHRNSLTKLGLQGRICKGLEKDLNEGKECYICRTHLHLSKIKGYFGKKSALCLQHAVQVMDVKKNKKVVTRGQDPQLDFLIQYSDTELKNILEQLQKRLVG